MITEAHIFGLGFTQDVAEDTGQKRRWREVRATAGPERFIHPPVEWHTSPKKLAGFIAGELQPAAAAGVEVRLFGYFYSWSGGWLFPRLARALQARGRPFDTAVLCDPVYRSPVWPDWMPTWAQVAPMSLLRSPIIKIRAGSVRRLEVVYQATEGEALQGHRVTAPGAIVGSRRITGVGHTDIDESDAYRELVRQVAGLD